jgi:sulfur carrier protein
MITVNGDSAPWTPDLTVRGVLRAKKYTFPLLIITLNGAIIPPKEYDATPVPDGSVVDVLHLLSGG